MAYHRYHGVDTKIVRIFNTFGPRMRRDDGRAVPVFINQALRHEPLTVFGDGSQTRSFGYITDLVRGIDLMIRSPHNDPINLGNPQEMTLLEMARLIIGLAQSRSGIVYQPLPEDDPKVRQPDISRAKQRLGWEPEVDVREALRLTIDWFRQPS
jgi:dTDP-glucose 4,6-dehydratase